MSLGSAVLLAFSLSLDAFGIGIAYGLRRMQFPLRSKVVVSIVTCLILFCFLILGARLFHILPLTLAVPLSMGMLCLFGLFFILQPFFGKKKRGFPLTLLLAIKMLPLSSSQKKQSC